MNVAPENPNYMHPFMYLLKYLLAIVISLGLLASMGLEALQPIWGSELTVVAAILLGTGLMLEQLNDKKTLDLGSYTYSLAGLSAALLLSLSLVPQLFLSCDASPQNLWLSSVKTPKTWSILEHDWQPLLFSLLFQCCFSQILFRNWRSYTRLRPVFFCGFYLVLFSGVAVLLRLSLFAYSGHLPAVELLLLPLFSLANCLLFLRYFRLCQSLAHTQLRNQNLSLRASELSKRNVHVLDRALLHSVEIRQKERLEIAREIHDVLGFTLSAGLMSTEVFLEELREDPKIQLPLQQKLEQQLSQQQERVRDAIHQVRLTVSKLRSPGRARFAEDWKLLLEIFGETTRTMVSHSIPESFSRLKNPAIGKLIYRIMQESLTNALRHGQANMIDVSMRKDRDLILLRISDNGRGCDLLQIGNGLSGMMERLELLGGKLAWNTAEMKGFDLGVEIPYDANDFIME